MAVGWYSKNIWNLCSWKWGQWRIMWELSSQLLPQRRHVGSTAGLTFDLWYLKKLWPVRCLMQRPRSLRFWSKSSLESFMLGDGKNIFVWRHSFISSHREIHFSMVCWRDAAFTALFGSGRIGPGPSWTCSLACFASMSASSFPGYPAWPFIHLKVTVAWVRY